MTNGELLLTLIEDGEQLMGRVESGRQNDLTSAVSSEVHSVHVRGRFALRGIDRSIYQQYCGLFSRVRDKEFDWHSWSAYIRTELERCVGVLKAVAADPEVALDRTPARVFISHGRFGPAFTKLETFVRALGCLPVYDTENPSDGKTINQHVETLFSQADFYVILAAIETTNVDGANLPNHNVVIEFDRLVQTKQDKILVLVEHGCRVPSMLQDVIRESYSPECMDAAFTKLAASLRRSNLL